LSLFHNDLLSQLDDFYILLELCSRSDCFFV